jgi:hypothetical protein
MAQVNFFPIRIRFQKLRELLAQYDETNFANLILQCENPDAQQNRDEYDLTAFVVRSNGNVQDQILDAADISRDPTLQSFRTNARKIVLGNYPLPRAIIEAYRDGSGGNLIEYLIFIPHEFSVDRRYISYTVRPRNQGGSRHRQILHGKYFPKAASKPAAFYLLKNKQNIKTMFIYSNQQI